MIKQIEHHDVKSTDEEESMKRSVWLALALTISLTFVMSAASCASVQKPSGFLDGYYKNMTPAPGLEGSWMRWVKPGADFNKYNKLMLDGVVFYLSPDSQDKGIDPDIMKDLADTFNHDMVNAVKDKYPLVAEPGPDVMRIKFALTGIKQSRPVLSGATTIIPAGLAISVIRKETTGAWSGSGATGSEVMVIDSITNEVIAVVQTEYIAGFSERFTEYGSAKDAFEFWAGRLRYLLDKAHGVK
jgi:hypothetical protein